MNESKRCQLCLWSIVQLCDEMSMGQGNIYSQDLIIFSDREVIFLGIELGWGREDRQETYWDVGDSER